MGFGSYDESEEQAQNFNNEDDDGEGVNVHDNSHDGEMTFESDASTADLIDQLGEIKATEEGE